MKPLKWWLPLLGAVIALAFGLVPYALLSAQGTIPAGLRDNPWAMELVAVLATVAAVFFAIQAFREKRVRALATVCATLATLSTAGFVFLVHFASYDLPPAPKELAVGTPAPEFTLPDEEGRPVSLASLRGNPTLLVFYRGSW